MVLVVGDTGEICAVLDPDPPLELELGYPRGTTDSNRDFFHICSVGDCVPDGALRFSPGRAGDCDCDCSSSESTVKSITSSRRGCGATAGAPRGKDTLGKELGMLP